MEVFFFFWGYISLIDTKPCRYWAFQVQVFILKSPATHGSYTNDFHSS